MGEAGDDERGGRALKIINLREIETFIDSQSEGYAAPVRAWARRAIRAHWVKNGEAKRVFASTTEVKEYHRFVSSILEDKGVRLSNHVHFIENVKEEWIKVALANHEPLGYIKMPAGFSTILDHAATLEPEKLIGMTYAQMLNSFHAEKAKLHKAQEAKEEQKIMEHAYKDVKVLFEKDDYTIVRLRSMSAVKGEGLLMNHCLRWDHHAASYFYGQCYPDAINQRDGLYSLRVKGEKRPRATIAISNNQQFMVKGYNNSDNIRVKDRVIISEWMTQSNVGVGSFKIFNSIMLALIIIFSIALYIII
jgi:hypothetical protein